MNSITLKVRQIKELAEFAGLKVERLTGSEAADESDAAAGAKEKA